MPPMEWHKKLKEAKEKNPEDKDSPIILDCRNTYETSVGRFEGAEPLDTTNFRDSWDILKDRLKDTPKDAPIMTYCTGGTKIYFFTCYCNLGYLSIKTILTFTSNSFVHTPIVTLPKEFAVSRLGHI